MLLARNSKKAFWKTVQRGIKILGLDGALKKMGYAHADIDHHHVLDYYGRSSSKQTDIRSLPGFGPLATKVIRQGRTYLYYDRLFTIFQALTNCQRIDSPLNLVEVGVYQGGTSYFIAAASQTLDLSGTHLYCFDTFEGHSALDIDESKDPYHRAGHFDDTEYERVKKYLGEFRNVDVIKGRFQETCQILEGKPLHVAHLDVDIYGPTIFGLNFFDERLAVGGVVVVDDYGFTSCPGAKAAVDEFVNDRPDYFFMELLTGQAVLVKKG
jgi:hypothetical protein